MATRTIPASSAAGRRRKREQQTGTSALGSPAVAGDTARSVPGGDGHHRSRHLVDNRDTVHDSTRLLRTILEEHLQRHSDLLGELTLRSRQPDRGGYDTDTLAALFASSHQAVADGALALRRMAEGTYGICERCRSRIPLERLQAVPHALRCVPCQRIRAD